jgi:hypothetical protein
MTLLPGHFPQIGEQRIVVQRHREPRFDLYPHALTLGLPS